MAKRIKIKLEHNNEATTLVNKYAQNVTLQIVLGINSKQQNI